ncbi:sulfite exporter TauE/SafE family protein [Lentisphaerota bacterium ZTH]|nr:sulfite exporter TauE/SafE family protein [Lentisphaerota bacterium]WET07084.1 sulfite exporter TauE/SafE family protein [Lentisphaerota bacterium ZTH]
MDILQYIVLAILALNTGISKTGLPAAGILSVPLAAMVFPAKISTGYMLLFMVTGDIFSVIYYHRHAQWNILRKLIPWTLLGLIAGSAVISHIDSKQLTPIIGFIVLLMLGLHFWNSRHADQEEVKQAGWLFAAFMAFSTGLTSQLANASAPVIIIYLLTLRLPKEKFIGTVACLFMFMNLIKLPLFFWEGRITGQILLRDIWFLPLVIIGGVIGIWIFKRLSNKWFNNVILALTFLAAVKLCWTVFELF